MKGRCLNTGRTHFKKGDKPWNVGTKGLTSANKTSFEKGRKPWNWKPKLTKECITCKQEFETSQGVNEKIYCSKNCSDKAPKSKEMIRKVKEARAKQIITPEHRRAQSTSLKKYYKENPKSKLPNQRREGVEYKLWRESVFKRDNYTCQECLVRGCELNAHHIKPYALFSWLRYELSNGQTLCIDCHNKTKTNLNGLWQRYGQEIMGVIKNKMLAGEI